MYSPSIYGSGKIDINCIANIVRNDLRLKAVLQGSSDCPLVFSRASLQYNVACTGTHTPVVSR